MAELVLPGSWISRNMELTTPACLWEGPGSSQTNRKSLGFLELQGVLLRGAQTLLLAMEGWRFGWVWVYCLADRRGVALGYDCLNVRF